MGQKHPVTVHLAQTLQMCCKLGIAVDSKVNGEITDSPKKEESKADTRQMNALIQTFRHAMVE